MQRKLSGLNIFEEPFVVVRENLRMGVTICEQWVVACDHLTGQVWSRSIWKRIMDKIISEIQIKHVLKMYKFSQVWKRHALHAWKGNKHCPQTLHCLAKRLDEVGSKLTIFTKNTGVNLTHLQQSFKWSFTSFLHS